jgi:hypothetical protein
MVTGMNTKIMENSGHFLATGATISLSSKTKLRVISQPVMFKTFLLRYTAQVQYDYSVLQENSTFISKRVSGLSVPYCSIASA